MSCRADTANVACAHRRMAVLKGRFAWRTGHGWVWADSKHPEQTWDVCPWCGGGLPDLDEAMVRKVRDWQANGWPSDVEPDHEC